MKVLPAIEADWLLWQREVHIPEVMATGAFTRFHFYKLLDQDESEGCTYVVQYFADTRDAYEIYIRDHAPLLRDKAQKKWGQGFIGFRTLMRAVH